MGAQIPGLAYQITNIKTKRIYISLQTQDKEIGCHLNKLHVYHLGCVTSYETNELHGNRWRQSIFEGPQTRRAYQCGRLKNVRSSVLQTTTEWNVRVGVSQDQRETSCLTMENGALCHRIPKGKMY